MSTKQKKAVIFIFYIGFLLSLLEISSRAFLYTNKNRSYKPDQLFSRFYPTTEKLKHRKDLNKDNGYFDVLLLGGSVIYLFDKTTGSCRNKKSKESSKRLSGAERLIRKLQYKTKKKVRLHNVAALGHTSLDSYYKYKELSNKSFDLIIFYHGINETRANNCPPSFFKSDYSHYSWYDRINTLDKYREIFNFLTFPYTFSQIGVNLKQKLFPLEYLPTHETIKKWVKYGSDIKSKGPFKANLTKILEIAKKKKEKVLLMSFAFCPMEDTALKDWSVWGEAKNVIAGIHAHNAITENLSRHYNNTLYIDQANLLSDNSQYFCDPCHFSHKGNRRFGDNMVDIITKIIQGVHPDEKERQNGHPLIKAVFEGYEDTVKKMLNKGIDINIKDDNGWTPLMLAADQGNKSLVELLLDKGADVNARDNDGRTTLMISLRWAVEQDYSDIVTLLINEGADMEVKDKYGNTILVSILKWAAYRGNKKIVKFLIEEKGVNVNAKDDNGWTPLMPAAAGGHKDIVEILLNKDADVNAKNGKGYTALMYAAASNHKDIVEILLNKGADVNAKNNNGWTPLMWAASRGHKSVVELLLDKDVYVNAKNKKGCTILMRAAAKGYQDIVEILLNNGASINTKDNKNKTALIYAVQVGSTKTVRVLLNRGADIRAKDNVGNTALMWAQHSGTIDIVKLLGK